MTVMSKIGVPARCKRAEVEGFLLSSTNLKIMAEPSFFCPLTGALPGWLQSDCDLYLASLCHPHGNSGEPPCTFFSQEASNENATHLLLLYSSAMKLAQRRLPAGSLLLNPVRLVNSGSTFEAASLSEYFRRGALRCVDTDNPFDRRALHLWPDTTLPCRPVTVEPVYDLLLPYQLVRTLVPAL